uniref:peptidylprolyl isomerase n=1 Tax=Altererythrobacter sp. TaxID=1872480 RepID=UPI003D02B3F0
NPRRVVIQLMPAPFSQGWVENVKLLAHSGYYDGLAVVRVQDNYVTQWADPAEDEADAKPLSEGLKVMGENEYTADVTDERRNSFSKMIGIVNDALASGDSVGIISKPSRDSYAKHTEFFSGWPTGSDEGLAWPVHCYGMVGVARGMSPSTGDGSSLYTVIGHAPRHLDRNIALVGRVIEGMEHLSSLPRGKGPLGFYAEDEIDKRTPIKQVRLASELHGAASSSEAVGQQGPPPPAFEYLSTESESFAKYAEARANRRDPFFIHQAGGADICNIPVPVRRVPGD